MNRHHYLQAIQALGVEVSAEEFPVIGNCPFCRTYELYIFTDFAVSSVWLTCRSCKKSGDIGQFAANLWNTSLPEAAKKFTEMGIVSAYAAENLVPAVARHSKLLSTADNFWAFAAAETRRTDDDDIRCTARALGVKLEEPATAGLLGVAHYEQVLNFCAAVHRRPPHKIRNKNYYVVVPFYDVPERFTGFLVAQYDSSLNLITKFIPLTSHKKYRPNAGYAFLTHALSESHARLRNTEIITNDVFWALEVQTKYIQKYGVALPVLASYDGPEATSYGTTWRMHNQATRIFHNHSVTPPLVGRACAAGGYVSACEIPDGSPVSQLCAVRAATRTWSSALSDTLVSLPEKNAAAFVGQIQHAEKKLQNFLAANFSKKICAALTQKDQSNKYGNVSVRADGIWSPQNTKISDAQILIEYVVYAENEEKFFTGKITTASGQEYSFQEYEKKLTRIGLLRYVESLLQKYEEKITYDSRWNTKILFALLKIAEPKRLTAATCYGWDEDNKVFRFLEFGINDAGNIVRTVRWPHKKGVADLPAPDPATLQQHTAEIQQKREDAYTWALVAAVAANLLAPIFGKDQIAIGISSTAFETAKKITQKLSCPELQIAAVTKKEGRAALKKIRAPMPWPTLFYNCFDAVFINNIVHCCFNRPVVAKISRHAAVVGPSYGWCVLAEQELPDTLPEILPAILPAFVQYVLTTKPLPAIDENIVDYTLKLLYRWLQETTGHTFNLDCAHSLLRLPDDAHTTLREEILYAIETEQLDVVAYPRHVNQKQNFVLEGKHTMWINTSAIDRYFISAKSTNPNWIAIAGLLKKHGLYRGEKTVNKQNGFFVPKDWFLGSEFLSYQFKTG